MLGKYEKRYFANNEKVWLGRYRNLNNILHWHSECELIRIVKGTAQIKVGNNIINAKKGNCLFCSKQELHYILSEDSSLIDVMIFHKDLLKNLTDKYKPVFPLIENSASINALFDSMHSLISNKPRFYTEALETKAKDVLLQIFNNNEICEIERQKQTDKKIIDKINENFATITFNEIALFSGYTPAHFSKVFKRLAGINFSTYLNHIKVAHAVSLIQNDNKLSITDISLMCGFATIRSFNRVFKQVTGFTPSTLPPSFTPDFSISIYGSDNFDPTLEKSVLL